MKIKLFTVTLLFCLATVSKIHAQGCTVPPVVSANYEDDINALAVRYMLATADSDLIDIPQIIHDDIAGGMAAIFNSSLLQRDSVFNLYCVHSPYLISLCKEWLIFFDPNYAWTTAWKNTQTVTGNAQVDNLFSAHSLYVDHYYAWSIGDAVLVKTTNNSSLNYDALFDSLTIIAGINSCESNSLIGTAGYITFSKTNSVRHYEFTYEWNDCFDGCDNSHTWKFDVDATCNVTFAGTSDFWVFGYEPLPVSPGNCLLSGINDINKNAECKIYPNPFSNKFNIEMPGNEKSELKIFDLSGREIITQKLTAIKAEVDLSDFSNGIYFYRVSHGKQLIVNGKIIKQAE